MLTIKAVYTPTREEIFEAQRVRTVPDEGGALLNVLFQPADGDHEIGIWAQDCVIYVMNDKGRTIAVYGG